MINQILAYFPTYTHPLTLVHDPDDLLTDESLLAALAERGFTLLQETDPIALHHRVQALRPFRLERPVIVTTAGALNELPYDLWQVGRQVKLALHTFFPNLSYPVMQSLSPHQRWQLSLAPSPPLTLGRQATLNMVLAHVFGVNLASLQQPARLITWLNDYHQRPDPMPTVLTEYLLAQLRPLPVYTGWPLVELLADAAAFSRFVEDQWRLYLQQQTGQPLAEARQDYLLAFDTDAALQDTLPRLVRSGALAPVKIEQPEQLPAWLRIGVVAADEDQPERRLAELLDLLGEQANPMEQLAEARWEQWQAIARTWAALTALYYDPDRSSRGQVDNEGQVSNLSYNYAWWQTQLDRLFAVWLQQRYAVLGGQKLPVPHHLYHIPTYIAHRRQSQERLALLVMDGMSLADWQLIEATWRARHNDWHFYEQIVLAQIPPITAISRQALVSGLRPAEFGDTLTNNEEEKKQWAAFWERLELPKSAWAYLRLALDRQPMPPELESSRLKAICLVTNAIDDLVHHASLGAADMQGSLKLWLKKESRQLETVIDGLLGRGFVIYLTSDHGHTQAQGIGQPSEGVLVETRSKRARIYRDRRVGEVIRQGFSETILWGQDDLLPDDTWALMPLGRQAFAPLNEIIVTHGGLALDEMVVPLVRITRQN